MQTYLESSLVVLDRIPLDIVMRSDGFFELGTDDHSGSFSGRTSSEEHDSSSGVGEGGLGRQSKKNEGNRSALVKGEKE